MTSYRVVGFSSGSSSDEDDGTVFSFGGSLGRGCRTQMKDDDKRLIGLNLNEANKKQKRSQGTSPAEESLDDWFPAEDDETKDKNKARAPYQIETYSLPLPVDDVVLVDNMKALRSFLQFLEEEVGKAGAAGDEKALVFAGVDSEWKPVRPSGVALLQIAFTQKVFLIDVKSFNDIEDFKESEQAFDLLAAHFFSAQNIIKIGYDFVNDMGMLSKTHPSWKDLSEKIRGILDLKHLKSEVQRRLPDFFPSTEEVASGIRGLSLLAHLCLGKSVDKTEQFSNWEKRPLKGPQIFYAAADAYCQLEIYEHLKERLAGQPFDLPKYVQACQDPPTKEVVKNLAPLQMIQAVLTSLEDYQLIKPEDKDTKSLVSSYFLVCDRMLAGLGKSLRYFGLQSVVLEQEQGNQEFDPRSMPLIPEGKELLIITRGKTRVQEFLSFYKPEEVLYVSEDKPIYQIVEIIRFKKILFGKEDAHRVCSNCNGDVFIKLEKEEVMEIVHCPTKHSAASITNALTVVTNHVPPELVFHFEDDSVRRWTKLKDFSCIRIEKVNRFGTVVNKAVTESGKLIKTNKLYVHLIKPYVDRVYVCDGCGASIWSSRKIEDMIFSA